MRIAIIGAGASGIMAALSAARPGANVSLFEKNQTPGRKLLVTGSGRCNLSNEDVSAEKYTCGDTTWLIKLFECFGVPDLVKTLESLGIPTYKTWDGWYYPRSNSAHSVVNTLAGAVMNTGIDFRPLCPVNHIERHPSGFKVVFNQNNQEKSAVFDRVIVSTGGKAYPTLGTTGDLYPVLSQLGHTINPIKPALAPVLAELGDLQAVSGTRLDAGIQLLSGSKVLASSAGNMIFTDWGLNGPAVMDISHHIPDPPGNSTFLSLILLYFVDKEFTRLLTSKRRASFPVSLLLGAFFPPKASRCFLRLSGIKGDPNLCDLEDGILHKMIGTLKDTRLKVEGVRGYAYCQASAGGVPVDEISPTTLESRVQPGLFLSGETLDVVGPCGGYNLHFAFASGSLAGRAAADHRSA